MHVEVQGEDVGGGVGCRFLEITFPARFKIWTLIFDRTKKFVKLYSRLNELFRDDQSVNIPYYWGLVAKQETVFRGLSRSDNAVKNTRVLRITWSQDAMHSIFSNI